MVSVDMTAKNPGEWLYHCHVTDHITAGMITKWTVTP
jgi:FtsP/CotA-like multicopper oxidase with cupredoxin domain